MVGYFMAPWFVPANRYEDSQVELPVDGEQRFHGFTYLARSRANCVQQGA
jgi:hypothetical protein